MSSGGGSTTTQQAQLPAWLENAAQENLGRARQVSSIGYLPNYGLDVAGFTPMQTSAMQNTANTASAFGLQAPTDAMAGMPQTTTDPSGFTGYSSGNLFDNAMLQAYARRPAQVEAINSMFVDPVTGEQAMTYTTDGYAVPTGNLDNLTNPLAMYGSDGGDSQSGAPVSQEQRIQNALDYLGTTEMNYPWYMPGGIALKAAQGAGNFINNSYLNSVAKDFKDQGLAYNPTTKSIMEADTPMAAGYQISTGMNGLPMVTFDPSYSQKGDWTAGGTGQGTGTTLYQGNGSTSDYGNALYSSNGYTWDDYGGYTGVTADNSGNDWNSFNTESGSGSSGGGTYCCTAMRKNGDWTSHIKVYRMHKWHYDQPQWWRDGYDTWGKIIADKLITKKGNFWAKCFDAFYEKHIKGGKSTIKSTIAEVIMYPPVLAIGMAKKLTGKHIELVEVGE